MFQKTSSVTETKSPLFTSSHELLYVCDHDETTWNLYMLERLRYGFQWYCVYSREQFQPEGIPRASGSVTDKDNISRIRCDTQESECRVTYLCHHSGREDTVNDHPRDIHYFIRSNSVRLSNKFQRVLSDHVTRRMHTRQ